MRILARWHRTSVAFRFVIAGAANTAFGLVVFALGILAGAPDWGALLGSLLAGLVFNFMTFGGYAFRQLAWANVPRFLLSYGVVYAVNLALLGLLGQAGLGAVGAQAVLVAPIACLSWLLMRHVVFRPAGGRP